MKKFLLIIIVVFISQSTFGQNLNSSDFHTHRESLKHSFIKFQNQKKGRVVFLGGSITYNPGWRDSVCNYLQHKFPETKFDFIRAGIPSMGSTPGAFRFERDVLKNGKVDLLFEEAAVNDDTNNRSEKEILLAMEGIVRHAKLINPDCDIVMMHFADPGKMENYRAGKIPKVIELHEKVAEHYNISTINLAKEVTQRIDAGEFDWENDFKDLHPSPFGQGIYANSIIQFLEDSEKFNDFERAKTVLPISLNDFCFTSGVLIEPNPPKPVKGWAMNKNWHPDDGKGTRFNYTNVPMLVGEYPAKVIKFRFKGNAVGIAVAAGPDAGIIEYSIDNSPWEKQDLFTQWSENLHLPWYYTLFSTLKDGKHTLQLRISDEKNVKSEGRYCRIRYFYFNQSH